MIDYLNRIDFITKKQILKPNQKLPGIKKIYARIKIIKPENLKSNVNVAFFYNSFKMITGLLSYLNINFRKEFVRGEKNKRVKINKYKFVIVTKKKISQKNFRDFLLFISNKSLKLHDCHKFNNHINKDLYFNYNINLKEFSDYENYYESNKIYQDLSYHTNINFTDFNLSINYHIKL